MLIKIKNNIIVFSLSIILLQNNYVDAMKKALTKETHVINLEDNMQNKFSVLPQELIQHILTYCSLHGFENFFLSCSAHYQEAKKYGNSRQCSIELKPWLRKYKKSKLNEVLNSIKTECFKHLIIPAVFFEILNSPVKITYFLNTRMNKPSSETKIYTEQEKNAIEETIEKNKLLHESLQGKIHINDLRKFPGQAPAHVNQMKTIAASFELRYNCPANKDRHVIYINTHSITNIKDFLQQRLPIYSGKKSILIVNSDKFSEIVNILDQKCALDNIEKLYIKNYSGDNKNNLNELLEKFPNTRKISITNSSQVKEFPDFTQNTNLTTIDMRNNFIQAIPNINLLVPPCVNIINLKKNPLIDPNQIIQDVKNISPRIIVKCDN